MELAERHRRLLADLARDGVRLAPKAEVWHQHVLQRLLAIVTLGQQRRYLTDYVTTLGRTIYLPAGWDSRPLDDRYVTLCHELVHVRQFERWGLIPMAIAYLLLPLPFGLAWCRMRLEREAYAETIRVTHALGGRAATARLRACVLAQFTSAAYGWMWPFPRQVAAWYDGLVATLESR